MLSFPVQFVVDGDVDQQGRLQESGPQSRCAAENLAGGVRSGQEAQGGRLRDMRFLQRLGDLGQHRAALRLAQCAARHQGERARRIRHRAEVQRSAAREASQTLVELQKDKTYDYSGRTNTGEGRFTSGECPIFLTSSAFFGNVKANAKFDFGNAPMPYYPDAQGRAAKLHHRRRIAVGDGRQEAGGIQGRGEVLLFPVRHRPAGRDPQVVRLSADHQGRLRQDQGVRLLQGRTLSWRRRCSS